MRSEASCVKQSASTQEATLIGIAVVPSAHSSTKRVFISKHWAKVVGAHRMVSRQVRKRSGFMSTFLAWWDLQWHAAMDSLRRNKGCV